LTKIQLIYSASYFNLGIWGVLELCLGGLSPQNPSPWRRDYLASSGSYYLKWMLQ